MKITKQQFCEVLDIINHVTDDYISYNIKKGNLKDTIVIKYYDCYEDECETNIYVFNGIIENPRIGELEKDILETEEKLAKLKGELAELKEEN